MIRLVIEAAKMEDPVQSEHLDFTGECQVMLLRLARGGLDGDHHVSLHGPMRRRRALVVIEEREHVGRFVPLTVLSMKLADFSVGDEHD